METKLAKIVGSAARDARKALSITQEDAAERIGISLEFYGRIERGGTLPSVPTLARMAEALRTSADSLLGSSPRAGVARERTVQRWSEPVVQEESRELRKLLRRLRRADRKTLRLLNAFVNALERR